MGGDDDRDGASIGLFYLLVKDSCEQSGVNTIESLQGFHPLLIGEFWPPFVRAMLFQLSYNGVK